MIWVVWLVAELVPEWVVLMVASLADVKAGL